MDLLRIGRPELNRLLSLFVVVCLLIVAPLSANADNKQKVRDLQRKSQSLQSKRAVLRQKKYEKLRQAQKFNVSLIQNQRRLESERRSLRFQQQRLEETKSKIVFLDNRLDKTTGDAIRLGTEAGQRLRSMYMGERLSMMQMVLEAENIAQLLDRIYYKKRIVAQDKKLLTELHNKIQELNKLKGQLAVQKSIIGQTIQTIQIRNTEIQRSIEVDRSLRDKYRNDARFYERAENELLAESSRITAQIRGLTSQKGFQKVVGSTGAFIWPISGGITSNFGYRVHPIHRTRKLHTGLDIGGPNGGTVRAADGGKVIYAGWKGGYGKTVMINHGNRNGRNLVTLYGHMSALQVSTGQNVSKGQPVGNEGSTGYSTGPHLHFEVRVDGVPVNPRNYL